MPHPVDRKASSVRVLDPGHGDVGGPAVGAGAPVRSTASPEGPVIGSGRARRRPCGSGAWLDTAGARGGGARSAPVLEVHAEVVQRLEDLRVGAQQPDDQHAEQRDDEDERDDDGGHQRGSAHQPLLAEGHGDVRGVVERSAAGTSVPSDGR